VKALVAAVVSAVVSVVCQSVRFYSHVICPVSTNLSCRSPFGLPKGVCAFSV